MRGGQTTGRRLGVALLILALCLFSIGQEGTDGQQHGWQYLGADHSRHELLDYDSHVLRPSSQGQTETSPRAPGAARPATPEICGNGCAGLIRPIPEAQVQGRAAIEQPFREGYRDAGGPATLERHFIETVIPCESSWRLDPEGYHLGLAQFHPETWRIVSSISGRTDWRSGYDQGYNVAIWLTLIDDPGGTGGWPQCWWAGMSTPPYINAVPSDAALARMRLDGGGG